MNAGVSVPGGKLKINGSIQKNAYGRLTEAFTFINPVIDGIHRKRLALRPSSTGYSAGEESPRGRE